MPNSFSGTIFMLEFGELESEMPHLYFFIPSVTDRCEEMNQCTKNVSLTPIDIKEQFNSWFNPSHLNMNVTEKSTVTETMVKCMEYNVKVSN